MIGTKQDILKELELADDTTLYELIKKNTKSIRSLAQNSYYHGIIVKTISDWSGDNVISVHYMLKEMFKLETTTNLEKDEFAFMCKNIIDLFKEKYGVIIPTPKDIKGEESLYASLGF